MSLRVCLALLAAALDSWRPAGSPVEMSLRVCLALWAAGVAWGPAAASGPAGEWSKAAASRYMPRACQGARPK